MIRFKVNETERATTAIPRCRCCGICGILPDSPARSSDAAWLCAGPAPFTRMVSGALLLRRNERGEGTSVTTIEGISAKGMHPVQKAWMEIKVPQCGYCQTGQIMQAIAFLEPEPQSQRSRRSTRPCLAISAAAEPTSAFEQRFIRLQRRWHEQYPECQPARIYSGCLCDGDVCAGRAPCPSNHSGLMTPVVRRRFFNRTCSSKSPSDGSVTIVAHRSEMGCGSRTALPLVVADELDADWSKVKIEQALGDAKYGDQDTDGSHSVRSFFDQMRQVGATARTMLVSAAAAKWGVSEKECTTEPSLVVHKASGRKLGYGELAAAAAKLPVPK